MDRDFSVENTAPVKDILRVEDVHISFKDKVSPWSSKQKEKDGLKGVTFSVKEGEVLGLV